MAKQGKHRAPATSATWFGRRREGLHRAGGAEAAAEAFEPEVLATASLTIVPNRFLPPDEPLAPSGPPLLPAPRPPVIRAVEDDAPRRRGRRAHPDADTDAIPVRRAGTDRTPSLYPFAVPPYTERADPADDLGAEPTADEDPTADSAAIEQPAARSDAEGFEAERTVAVPLDFDEGFETPPEAKQSSHPAGDGFDPAGDRFDPADEVSASDAERKARLTLSGGSELIAEVAPVDEPLAETAPMDEPLAEATPVHGLTDVVDDADDEVTALDRHDPAELDDWFAGRVMRVEQQPAPQTPTELSIRHDSGAAAGASADTDIESGWAAVGGPDAEAEDLAAPRRGAEDAASRPEIASKAQEAIAPVRVIDLDDLIDLDDVIDLDDHVAEPASGAKSTDPEHTTVLQTDRTSVVGAAPDVDESTAADEDADEAMVPEADADPVEDWAALLLAAQGPAAPTAAVSALRETATEAAAPVSWIIDDGSDEPTEAVESEDAQPGLEDHDPALAWARLVANADASPVVRDVPDEPASVEALDQPDQERAADVAGAHPLGVAQGADEDQDVAVDLPAAWGDASTVSAQELDDVRSETVAIALPDLAPAPVPSSTDTADAAPAPTASAQVAASVPARAPVDDEHPLFVEPSVRPAPRGVAPASVVDSAGATTATKAREAPVVPPGTSGLVRKRPPLMSRNTVVGLDFGYGVIRAAEVALVAKGRPVLVRYQEIVLPREAVKEGVVVDQRMVVDTLRQLWSLAGFRTKNVVIGMGSQQVLIRELVVPRMPLAQLRETLPFRVQDTLPLPVEEALLDFVPTAEFEAPEGPQLRGLLIAATRESVLANARAVDAAGLRVMDVDLIPFAVSRATLGEGARTGTEVLLHVGAVSTSIVVTDDGVPQFVRTLQTGGDEVTAAIVDGLGVDPNRAERIKRAVGMSGARASDEQSERAAHIAADAVGELVRAVRATISFYRNAHPDAAVDGVLLSGGGGQLRGFSGALSVALGLPVTSARTGAGFAVGPKVDEVSFVAAGPAPTVALGLTLRSSAA